MANERSWRWGGIFLRGLLSILAAAVILGITSVGAAAEEEDIHAVFASVAARWEDLRAYACVYTLRSFPPGEEDGVGFSARYLFAKPLAVRVEIFQGKGAGTTLLWEGGDTMRVRKGGLLSMFPLTLDLRNSLLLDPFGQDLHRSTWKYLLDEGRQGLQEGRLELVGQEIWEDRPVLVLAIHYPQGDGPFFHDRVYIDRKERWPVRVVRTDRVGRVLQETVFQQIQIDPPVEGGAFREF